MSTEDKQETETVKIEDYNIERTSDKAILITKDNREYWIPKSQITGFMGDPEMPDTIVIPKWLAEKKGLMPHDLDLRVACPESVEDAQELEANRQAQLDYDEYKAQDQE